MDRLLIMQTCDPIVYAKFLEHTSAVNQEYADRQGFRYFKETSIRKGYYPWHAAFNRIYILKEMLRAADLPKWILYLDADAYVADLSESLFEFAESYPDKAFLFSRGRQDVSYDVNAGVFFLQPRHFFALEVIDLWHRAVEESATAPLLKSSPVPWSLPFEDQSLLQGILYRFFQKGILEKHVHTFFGKEASAMNYWGGRIRHVLRSNPAQHESLTEFEHRVNLAKSERLRLIGR